MVVPDVGQALTRLRRLGEDSVLSADELDVAEAAMLSCEAAAGRGRALRVAACDSLKGWAGAQFIIEDRLGKVLRGRYGWSELAMILTPGELERRILGATHATDPARWNDALEKLEQFHSISAQQSMSDEQLASVKCRLLRRLNWFTLVGELLWHPERWDELDLWIREDGWAATKAAVDEWQRDFFDAKPFEQSGKGRLGDYLDWVSDECWRTFDKWLAGGDIAYLRSQGIQQRGPAGFAF